MIYFTSDQHFDHFNIIKYCNRPFSSIEEMNETLIYNWNSIIKNTDNVYHLGDFGFCNYNETEKIVRRLNGNKLGFIIGSHDKNCLGKIQHTFQYTTKYKEIIINDIHIILFHCPIQDWDKKFHGSWHLHGHSHGRVKSDGILRYDIGVDTNNFKPISFDELFEHFKNIK